jgi:hypothetical protein
MTAAPTPIPAETEGQAPILLSTSDPVFAMVLTAALAPEFRQLRKRPFLFQARQIRAAGQR